MISQRRWKLAYWFLMAFSFALLAAGVASWSAGASETRSLRVDEESKSFGRLPPSSQSTVTFTLHNDTRETIRVVGSTPNCTLQGCLEATGLPLEIPGRESRDLSLLVKATGVGDFENAIVIYTSCPERSKVWLKVRGVVESPTP